MTELNSENFDKEVTQHSGLVLVDFWAPWCGPCRMLAPIIDELSKAYEGRVKFGKLNIDSGRTTAEKFDILSIPTIIIFRDGKVEKRLEAVRPKSEYESALQELL